MSNNLVNYIQWRGDLSFREKTFNEVDALVLCQISYLNFDGILQSGFQSDYTISTLWQAFKSDRDFEKRSDLGVLINKDTFHVLEAAALSERFGEIRVSSYVNKIDLESEEQFSAVTFFLTKKNRNPFVIFRGTDDTIVGWKEDFNMSFSESVPAQKDAAFYLESIAALTRGNVTVAGHSKGGNLAVYSAVSANSRLKRRIKTVYNFDGPGFPEKFFKEKEFKAVSSRIKTFYPESSVVGMLFSHAEKYTVVKSENSGAWQHDAVSWIIERQNFVTEKELSASSIYFNKTFNSWIDKVEPEKLELFTETVFDALETTGASTNSQFGENLFDNFKRVLKALTGISKDTRDEFIQMGMLLFQSVRNNFKN
ncbi:MAG: DUF2974 domain-containing protein [Treponema sp.]|nr:DUF2974 domain-containing protein [Candidatus Treponema merdequi]